MFTVYQRNREGAWVLRHGPGSYQSAMYFAKQLGGPTFWENGVILIEEFPGVRSSLQKDVYEIGVIVGALRSAQKYGIDSVSDFLAMFEEQVKDLDGDDV